MIRDVVLDFQEKDAPFIQKDKYLNGVFSQTAACKVGVSFLNNEHRYLQRLRNTGFVPKIIAFQDDGLLQTVTAESEPVTDEVAFRRNCAKLLIALRENNVKHGDLTAKNIIVRDNKPIVIDFKQSKDLDDPSPSKRPGSDADWLWPAALEFSPDTSRHIRRWIAIRPYIGDEPVIDLGCAEADFLAMCIADRKIGQHWGYDINATALKNANDIWGEQRASLKWYMVLREIDLLEDTRKSFLVNLDTVFFMSVFAHMYKENWTRATNFLKDTIENSCQVFFETQLFGDGPGPVIFKSDYDVYEYLKDFGKTVERIACIPVHGRDAARSVWRIT